MTVSRVKRQSEVCDGIKDISSKMALKTENIKTSVKSKIRTTQITKPDLVSRNPKPDTILIPTHFNCILNTFVSLDIVVNKLIKQRSSLYIERISEVLKEMNIKNFDAYTFGQILNVFPESYLYEYDKPPVKVTRHYKEKLKLIPNLDFGNQIDSLPRKLDKCFRLDQLIFRRTCFHERLLKIVQEKHNDFLVNVKNMSKLEAENLSNNFTWHMEFNLETDVENIQPVTLEKNEKCSKSHLRKSSELSSKELDKDRKSVTISPLPRNSNVPPKEFDRNSSSITPSLLSITINSSPKVLNENNKSISKSPITSNLFNSSKKRLEKNKKSTVSSAISVFNNSPLKVVDENKKSISKSPLSMTNKLFYPSPKALEKNRKSITESPLSMAKESLKLLDKSNKDKSLKKPFNLSVKISPKPLVESRKSVTECKSVKDDNELLNKTRKSIIVSPSKKPFNLSAKITPERFDIQKSPLVKKDTLNSTPKPLNQSRLSFALNNSNCSTPRGNFIANLSVSNSPVMKDEFLLKQKLPSHLKTLFELFISLEKLVYDYRRKREVTYFSKIMNSGFSKHNLSELQLGRIMTIYPEAYIVKLEQVLSVHSMKPTKKIDIAIKPNLGTGFLKFDFAKMKERRQKFLENCIEIVVSSYREFLIKNSIHLERLDEHIKNENWNNDFNIDLHVKMVEPSALPSITKHQETENGKLSFSQFFNVVKKRETNEISLKNNYKYKSLSQSLMDKVKLNKAKQLIWCGTTPTNENRHLIISKLPEIINIIGNEFRICQYKPLDKSYLSNLICKNLSIHENAFDEYLNVLIELVPGWIEKLEWVKPHLSIEKSNLSFDEVTVKLNNIIANQRA